MRRLRLVLWVVVALLAIGAGALLLVGGPRQAPLPEQPYAKAIGGPFVLTGADGKSFSSRQLAGKPFAIFFGFTNCPDVCPTTLARLVRLRKQAGAELPIVFVSVDPERDKPADVGRYSQLFGPSVVGLTGSPEAIDAVKKSFGIFSEKVPAPGGGYSVNHTASVFLMDRGGGFFGTISPAESDEIALQKLQRLVG